MPPWTGSMNCPKPHCGTQVVVRRQRRATRAVAWLVALRVNACLLGCCTEEFIIRHVANESLPFDPGCLLHAVGQGHAPGRPLFCHRHSPGLSLSLSLSLKADTTHQFLYFFIFCVVNVYNMKSEICKKQSRGTDNYIFDWRPSG